MSEHPAPDDLPDDAVSMFADSYDASCGMLPSDRRSLAREVRRRRDQETAIRAHVEKLRGNVSMKCLCRRDDVDELVNGHDESCLHAEWAAVLRILDGET